MAENTKSKGAEGSVAKWRLSSLKTLAMILGVFVLEAVAVGGMFFVFSPGPVSADDKASIEAAQGERPVEVLVVTDRFANLLSGRTYLYDTEVVIRTRNKHREGVELKLKERRAQIRADIAEVFRAAEPAHLHETTLATIKRQIQSKLNGHFGRNEQDEHFVDEVIIPRCTEYRADI